MPAILLGRPGLGLGIRLLWPTGQPRFNKDVTAEQSLRALEVLRDTRRGTGRWPIPPEEAHVTADRILRSFLRFHHPELYDRYVQIMRQLGGFWYA